MLPIHKIVCPTDFSEASYEALDTAIELAAHFHAELCLAHVIPPAPPIPADPAYVFQGPETYSQELQADAETRLKAVVENRIPRGLRARTAIAHGDAATEIVHIADTEAAEVIVISTHGLTGWRHLVFGSVAEKVVRLARRPVLVIPTSHPESNS